MAHKTIYHLFLAVGLLLMMLLLLPLLPLHNLHLQQFVSPPVAVSALCGAFTIAADARAADAGDDSESAELGMSKTAPSLPNHHLSLYLPRQAS